MSWVTQRGKNLLLTFLNVLRQPLQTFEQAFPCGGTTKQAGGKLSSMREVEWVVILTSGGHTTNGHASDEGPASR